MKSTNNRGSHRGIRAWTTTSSFAPIRWASLCRISPISSSLSGSPFLSIRTNFLSPSPLYLHLLFLLWRIPKSNLGSLAHAIKSCKIDHVLTIYCATHEPNFCVSRFYDYTDYDEYYLDNGSRSATSTSTTRATSTTTPVILKGIGETWKARGRSIEDEIDDDGAQLEIELQYV